jgi:hypothetical protein
LKIQRDICFEEFFDILKVTNMLDSEGWLFPLEFDRQNLLITNEYERLKLLKLAMGKFPSYPDYAIYGDIDDPLELEKSMEVDNPNSSKKINVDKIEDEFQEMLNDKRAKGLLNSDYSINK